MKDGGGSKLRYHLCSLMPVMSPLLPGQIFFSSPQPCWTPHPVCFREHVFPSCLCSGSSHEERHISASVRTLQWKPVSNGRRKGSEKFLKCFKKLNTWRSKGENVVCGSTSVRERACIQKCSLTQMNQKAVSFCWKDIWGMIPPLAGPGR